MSARSGMWGIKHTLSASTEKLATKNLKYPVQTQRDEPDEEKSNALVVVKKLGIGRGGQRTALFTGFRSLERAP